jgi:methionine sulfoxide reductase heme-binding subunit
MHSSSIVLWYTSRATGVVSLVLLTAVLVLGLLVTRQGRLPGLPRFGALSLHRYLSLLAVGFLVVHILTAVADTYVSIPLIAAILPFTSHYQPFWLGLGAVGLDLMIALIVTSLLRARIGRRTWRAVHWLAYASWPVAIAHSIGSGPDLRSGLLLGLTIASVLAVLAAIGWRVAATLKATPRRRLVPDLLAARELPSPAPLLAQPAQTAQIRAIHR